MLPILDTGRTLSIFSKTAGLMLKHMDKTSAMSVRTFQGIANHYACQLDHKIQILCIQCLKQVVCVTGQDSTQDIHMAEYSMDGTITLKRQNCQQLSVGQLIWLKT